MKRIYMVILTVICAIGIAISISYAWFYNGFNVDPLATGTSAEAYYHSGRGTESDPYIITTPRHLYNLAWLQYLGTYNKEDKNNNFSTTYFKVGLTSGITLDMSDWKLPPIGTTKYPFIGNFNGNGATITNLTTTNSFSELEKHPSGVNASNFDTNACSVIGFFGSIGSFDDSVIANTKTEGTYSYDSSKNQVYNFYLNTTSVHTSVSTTLIGVVAGYVNGTIQNVGIIQNNLNISAANAQATSITSNNSSNISEFAVVGYAEEEYTTQKTKSSTIIYNPTYNYSHFNFNGMGANTDWGGSMNMTDLYKRIVDKIPYAEEDFEYINSEIQYSFEHAAVNTKTTETKMVTNLSNDERGNYIKTLTVSGSRFTSRYNYLNAVNKSVVKVEWLYSEDSGFTLKSNDNYLNMSSTRETGTLNFNVSIYADSTAVTAWNYELNSPGYNLFTYNKDDGKKYYLVVDDNFRVSISNSPTTNYHWQWDTENDSYYISYNNDVYYLKCFSDEWTIYPTYSIGDGNGHYISYDNGVSTADNLEDALLFMYTSDGQFITNDGKYLRNNAGTLEISSLNNNNSWDATYSSISIMYNNRQHYIQYVENEGWKLLPPAQYYIQYDGIYVYLDGNGDIQVDGTENVEEATKFTISGYEIYASIGDETYYLQYDGNTFDTSTTSNANTIWYEDDYGFYRLINNEKCYINFNGVWNVNTVPYNSGFYLNYNGNNYLSVNGTSLTRTTSPTTVWYSNGTNIYIIINGQYYYLYSNSYTNGSSAVLKTTVNGNYVYTINGKTLKVKNYNRWLYYNGSWICSNSSKELTWTDVNVPNYDDMGFGTISSAGSSDISIEINNTIMTSKKSTSFDVYRRTEGISQPSVYNYIPLNTAWDEDKDDYVVEQSNTGYIMSGAYAGQDIRVSEYYINNINRNDANLNYTPANKTVYVNSGYVTAQNFVSFKQNVIKTRDDTGVHNIVDLSNDYNKYSTSKTNLENALSNNGKNNNYMLYGLHFMNASISMNHIVTAPKVLINGQYYTNYQMPEDCIDFTVARNGYINFFAGTYFQNNSAFFSLHQIFRDETDSDENGKPDNPVIKNIKHIYQIYKPNSKYGSNYKSADVVYIYSDGSSSLQGFNTNSDKYDKVFDYIWIEQPGTCTDIGNNGSGDFYGDVFYFEIPVNKGEFALGSVTGRTGAYLFYLDIGANAAPVDRTEITQQTRYTEESLVYANGIQILATGNTYSSDANSAVAYIAAATSGSITLSRNGNSISISRNGSGLNSTYYHLDITYNGSLSPISSSSSVYNVLRYVDYNRSTDKLYYTTIYNDGTENTGYECYVVDSSGNKTSVADSDDPNQWGLLKVSGTSGVEAELDDDYFDFTTSTSTKILDYYSLILTSEVSDFSDGNEIKVDLESRQTPLIDGDYTYERTYVLVGNAITMAPDGLVVYIGPDTKANATVSYSNNVATVTVNVSYDNKNYTFTFNASAANTSAKTVTISVS